MRLPTSGRTQHTHKITVYLSEAELRRLEAMTEDARRIGIRTDRGRVVREALALAYKDIHLGGPKSMIVRRLAAGPEGSD